MIKVLFVCLGNICRSPMAEFVFQDMVEKRGLADRFYIASAGTSDEERGNPVHRGTREKLQREGIPLGNHRATQMRRSDYEKYDYLIGMEERNLSGMCRIAGGDPEGKIRRLLDFSDRPRDIADPWYTGNFDLTYEDIREGCQRLLEYIIKEQRLF
jgi:protein-tyrosine phosphatase